MKLFTLLVLLSGLSFSASAQMSDRVAAMPSHSAATPVTELDADALTRQMAQQLQLNESQYIRLRTINYQKMARVSEIKWHYEHEPDAQQRKLQELEQQYEQECRTILNPKQAHQMLEQPTPPTQQAESPKQSGWRDRLPVVSRQTLQA